jgi:phage protein U
MSAWGAIGQHVFKLRAGPNAETLKLGTEYAQHARIGRKATQQATAPRLQEMELSITLHGADYGPAAVMEALKKSMEEGEILDLVHGEQPGTGVFAGQWILTDMDIESIARAPGGAIYSADLKLKLREWAQREGLEVSKRQPPPAVKTAAAKPKPALTGPGYK